MSAPTDRVNDPNSPSYYAPRGARPARSSAPEESPPALVPDDTHSRASRAPLVKASEPFEGDVAVQRLRARRSLDPEFAPAPPLPLRNKSWLALVGRLGMVIFAAAVVALIAVGPLPLRLPWHQPASDRTVSLASSSARPAALAGKRIEPEIPRLLVRASRGTSGEPAPLGVTLQGRADGGIIMIIGLTPGMTLSTGSAVGGNAWQVPATEAVLDNTWIIPPKEFVGVVELVAELHLADASIAHRRPIHLEWVAATPPAAANVAVEAAPPAVAPPSPPAPAQRQLDREELAILVKHGRDFIAAGDFAAARVVLQRAAEAKDAEAALILATTYDPMILRELRVYGFAADAAMARAWYEKAKELGSLEAPRRLEILASGTR